MADMMFALGQTKKKKKEENKVRTTKSELKNVTITDTVEKDIRKEQHDREQKWKATGRDQIKQNTNFDMARSLFGGGGPAPAADDDEVEEHYEQQAAQQEEEYAEEEVADEEVVEEEVVSEEEEE